MDVLTHAGQFRGKRTTTPRWNALVLAHANTFPFPKKMQAITSLFTVSQHRGQGRQARLPPGRRRRRRGRIRRAPVPRQRTSRSAPTRRPGKRSSSSAVTRLTPTPTSAVSAGPATPSRSPSRRRSRAVHILLGLPILDPGVPQRLQLGPGSSSSSSAGSAQGRPTHYDPDQYDPDANQRHSGGGGGGGGYSAPTPSYGGSTGGGYAAAKPQRVTRGSDGVVYDPDQYDPDANQRSR